MLRHSIFVPHQWKGFIALLFVTAFLSDTSAEIERLLRVPESASVGQQVGFVQDPLPKDTEQQNFYVVFTNPTSQAEKVGNGRQEGRRWKRGPIPCLACKAMLMIPSQATSAFPNEN